MDLSPFSIDAPWFRCQALAWSARYADDSEFDAIVEKSIASSFACEEPYRVVGSSAWPIRAIVEHGRVAHTLRVVSRAVRVADKINDPVSRADALFLVRQAVLPAGQKLRHRVLEPLLSACAASRSWKGAYLVRDSALILGRDDATAAQAIVDAMPEGRHKQQAHRRINEDELMQPRPFFRR